jgi:hypothetical protein
VSTEPLDLEVMLEPFGPATAILLTDAQVEQLGGGKRAPVTARIGEHLVRARLAVMGGQNCIGLSKAARATLGVDIGDHVRAQVARDEAPREVEVPEDVASALVADPGVAQALTSLAYTHRKECAV